MKPLSACNISVSGTQKNVANVSVSTSCAVQCHQGKKVTSFVEAI